MYGIGFLVVAIASTLVFLRPKMAWVIALAVGAFAVLGVWHRPAKESHATVSLVGVQLEFPSPGALPKVLDYAVKRHPDAQIYVLSEYTLEGGVTDSLREWCRKHPRYLVVGGKDFVTNEVYYNTVFVVGTNGETVFQQAKCVPIQFLKDGLPAIDQKVWNSPWGKVGFRICYDLSYIRVVDKLVRKGAQIIIVPTMDVAEWGRYQHELHSRVAPVRAAEYGLPIFRVASSGVSQAVGPAGNVLAKTSVGGVEEMLAANLELPQHGSIPIDRILAPLCVLVTGVILVALPILAWKKSRNVGTS